MAKKTYKNFLLATLLVLGVIFMINFAAAEINVSIGSTSATESGTTSATGSGTNYSNSSTLISQDPMVTFNVTLLNATDITFNVTAGGFLNPVSLNASFYLVTEGKSTWTFIASSLNCSVVSTRIASCWTNISTSATAGNFNISTGRYNITAVVRSDNNITGRNSTINVTMVIFDHDAPFNVNITGVPNGQNHSTRSNSGNLTLNVSIADKFQGLNASSGFGSVIFNIINITGNTNRTLTATREGTTQYWSTSVNTSEFIDGKYNITVQVNDSAGNFNSTQNSTTTAPIFSLFFDNTLPSVSMSCTPTTVASGDTETCSCSGTATSGINATTYTTNPSTVNTGTFSETCSVTSRSGLTNTGSSSFTVELSGGGGGTTGGSGGTGGGTTGGSAVASWSKTIPSADQELSEKGPVNQDLGSKERVTLKVSGESHYVGVVSVTETTATIEVSSTPQSATFQIGETKKFELTSDNFYDVAVTLNSITNKKADVTIKAIQEEVTVEEEAAQGEAQEEAERVAAEEARKSTLWIIAIIVVIIIIVLVVWFAMKKKQ